MWQSFRIGIQNFGRHCSSVEQLWRRATVGITTKWHAHVAATGCFLTAISMHVAVLLHSHPSNHALRVGSETKAMNQVRQALAGHHAATTSTQEPFLCVSW